MNKQQRQRLLRHPWAIWLVLLFVGVLLLLVKHTLAYVLASVFLIVGLMFLVIAINEHETAFWRSQFEWWDDQEWTLWENGHDIPQPPNLETSDTHASQGQP